MLFKLYNINAYKQTYNEGKYNEKNGLIMYIKSELVSTYGILKLSDKNRLKFANIS